MINANDPIYARPYSHDVVPEGTCQWDYAERYAATNGLTVRAHFASLFMAGLMGNDRTMPLKYNAESAVRAADILIKELNATP